MMALNPAAAETGSKNNLDYTPDRMAKPNRAVGALSFPSNCDSSGIPLAQGRNEDGDAAVKHGLLPGNWRFVAGAKRSASQRREQGHRKEDAGVQIDLANATALPKMSRENVFDGVEGIFGYSMIKQHRFAWKHPS